MCVTHKVIFLCVQVAVAFSALPPIQKCQLKDSSCLKSSAQLAVPAVVAGIPEVGTEPLDPLHVKAIDVDLAGLKLNLRDADILGLKNAIIDKLSFDMDRKQIQLVYHTDLVLKGPYKASGQLLILPISGDGQANMKLKNCYLTMDIVYDITKNSDGKDIIDLKSYKYNYDVKDGANFRLTNLFNGNKAASETMHTFMNTSWKLLLQEFGVAVFNPPMEKVFKALKTYFRSQPIEAIANV